MPILHDIFKSAHIFAHAQCTSEHQSQVIDYSLYIHTYIPHTLYPEGVAEASQIFLRGAYVLPKLLSYEEYCRYDRW
jgi:hypothetical protein